MLVPLASVYLQTGQHERATSVLETVLALDPQDADAYRWLGKVHEDQGQADEAEAAYRRAIDLRPDLWIYPYDLGQMVLFEGRASEAVELFERVGSLAPDNHLGDILLGVAQMQLDRFAEADSILHRSIRKKPDALAYRNLGHLYLLQLRFPDAIESLRSGLALSERDPWSWRLLGHAHYWNGDIEESQGAWRRYLTGAEAGLSVNPNDVDALAGLAEVHAILGEASDAQPYLDRIADLPLKWNLMAFYAGRAHELLSQREAALTYIEQALEEGLSLSWVEQDPWLEDFRQDPRYPDVASRFRNP